MKTDVAKQPENAETFGRYDMAGPRGGTADATDLKSVASSYTNDLRQKRLGENGKGAASESASAPDVITYFIQAGDDGLIKIGRTRNVQGRLETLRCGSPLPLAVIGIVYADIEAQLHESFRAFRSHGEWFYPNPFLLRFIQGHACPFDASGPRPTPAAITAIREQEMEKAWAEAVGDGLSQDQLARVRRSMARLFPTPSPEWSAAR